MKGPTSRRGRGVPTHWNFRCEKTGNWIWRLCSWCSYRAKSLALKRFPRHVAPHVLPQALKPPDHVQLPVREMFEETVRHQAGHVLPVAVPLVGKFFLQDGADRNHRGERVTKNHELNEKTAAEVAQNRRDNNRDDSTQLYNRRNQFVDPKIRQGQSSYTTVR